jgi:hypothetical protein
MAVTPKMIIDERKVVEKQRKDSLIQAATDHIDSLLREKFTIVAQPVNLSNDELGKPVIDANKYWDEITTTYQSSGWKVEEVSGGYRFTAQETNTKGDE